MVSEEPGELVIEVSAPVAERFQALDRLLAAMPEATLLLMLTSEGTHISSNPTASGHEDIVRLVMTAVVMLIEQWKETVGESGAEQLFALFVTSVAEKMEWRKSDRKRQAN